MGCRLKDYDIGEWKSFAVGEHVVEHAPAKSKPIMHRGKVLEWSKDTTPGHVYKLDGKFQGFTAMACNEAEAIKVIKYHVDRKLRGEP